MDIIEKTLREALELLDGVSVKGRENRRLIMLAEQKIECVADGAREAQRRMKEKEAGKDDENRDGQRDV